MEKLNIRQKKSDITNAILTYFSDETYILNRKYKHVIPYEEEKKLYDKLCIIENFLKYQGIDVQEMKDTNRLN